MVQNIQKVFELTPEKLEYQYKQLVVSSDHLKFAITEDIKNASGTLLVKSGKNIDKPTCEKLLQHRLSRPLDDYLQFANQVTNDTLMADIIGIGSSALRGSNLNFDAVVKSIKDVVASLQYNKAVRNKLTVYKYDSPDNFDHALSVALLGNEMGKMLGFSLHQLADLFSVCLLHDIGEMHLEKSIYGKEEVDDKDYQRIKTHPVLSYILLRESKTDFNSQVLSAVLNHHERLDKSGYPRNLPEKNINRLARIVAIADTFDALRRKGRSCTDALWAVSVQGNCRAISGEAIVPAFDPELIEVLQNLLQTDAGEVSSFNEISWREQKQQLQDMFTKLNSINDDVVQLWNGMTYYLHAESFGRVARQLQQVQSYLYKVKDLTLASSGIVGIQFDSLFMDEGGLVEAHKDLYRMAPELKYQLGRIQSMFVEMGGLVKDSQLADLVALNRTVYKKCSDLYRETVVTSTFH